jgi:hypothetical protein
VSSYEIALKSWKLGGMGEDDRTAMADLSLTIDRGGDLEDNFFLVASFSFFSRSTANTNDMQSAVVACVHFGAMNFDRSR